MMKHGINKIEDFSPTFPELGEGKPLRIKCYYLWYVSISFVTIRKK